VFIVLPEQVRCVPIMLRQSKSYADSGLLACIRWTLKSLIVPYLCLGVDASIDPL